MIYVMLNDLPFLNNYQVFTSPGYVMEESLPFVFRPLTENSQYSSITEELSLVLVLKTLKILNIHLEY